MSAASISKDLMKVLAMPSKIASKLNWNKTTGGAIMTLDVHADRIGLAIAHHPSNGEQSYTYDSLPLTNKGKIVPQQTKQRLAEIVQEQNVCGFVVNWPVQHDTGRLGYAAGRTLHTIEQLLNDTSIVSQSRPICLWDSDHSMEHQPPEDKWGRSEVYTRISDQSCHLASKEQYHPDDLENTVAANVWNDFMKTNWPDIYKYQQQDFHEYDDGNNKMNLEMAI
jgi:RNase H-fold protein (predicted Holliday junction resolvase)